jgi:hypothetical protein
MPLIRPSGDVPDRNRPVYGFDLGERGGRITASDSAHKFGAFWDEQRSVAFEGMTQGITDPVRVSPRPSSGAVILMRVAQATWSSP